MRTSTDWALLVLDIQQDFTGPHARMPIDPQQRAEILPNINRLVQHADQAGWLIVYIGNEFARFDPLNLGRNAAAIKGSAGAALDPDLLLIGEHYIPKHAGDAFSNPRLLELLRQHNVTGLSICGVFADACVLSTTR